MDLTKGLPSDSWILKLRLRQNLMIPLAVLRTLKMEAQTLSQYLEEDHMAVSL